ncbi:hypothetical protein [Luteolibacter sp. Populi]|uniref:hypothetical protein n=1 Tax=Luteolibacter sp. Populi TaxID=3230487 RepID=UPI003467CF26
MKRNRLRRNLIALQACSVFFLTVLFAAGVFHGHVFKKIETNLAAHPVAELNRKLSTRIGQPFTRELHENVVGIVTLGAEGTANLSSASRSLSGVILNISGFAIFLSLFSIFLVLRSPKEADGPPARDPAEDR